MSDRNLLTQLALLLGWTKGHYKEDTCDYAQTYFSFFPNDEGCYYSAPLHNDCNGRVFGNFNPFKDWNHTMSVVALVQKKKGCGREGITEPYLDMLEALLELDQHDVCLSALKTLQEKKVAKR